MPDIERPLTDPQLKEIIDRELGLKFAAFVRDVVVKVVRNNPGLSDEEITNYVIQFMQENLDFFKNNSHLMTMNIEEARKK